MESGKLRHLLTHQRCTEIHGLPAAWDTVGTYWGSVDALGGQEKTGEVQVTADATHRIVIRADGVMLTSTDRFVFNNRNFYVLTWEDVEERNRELRIVVKEVK